jgi:hypothetical protein
MTFGRFRFAFADSALSGLVAVRGGASAPNAKQWPPSRRPQNNKMVFISFDPQMGKLLEKAQIEQS